MISNFLDDLRTAIGSFFDGVAQVIVWAAWAGVGIFAHGIVSATAGFTCFYAFALASGRTVDGLIWVAIWINVIQALILCLILRTWPLRIGVVIAAGGMVFGAYKLLTMYLGG